MPRQIRHGAGLPYYCFDLAVSGQEVSHCLWQQDLCEDERKRRSNDSAEIVKSAACDASDEAYCFSYVVLAKGPGGIVVGVVREDFQCARTAAECEGWKRVLRDRNDPYLDARNESDCQRLDRSFQPPR